tara:strand:- start:82 stop:351 length:270 start_codon:yes stop_codon:yes gene_type:complete
MMAAIKNIDRTKSEVVAFLKEVEEATTTEIYFYIKDLTDAKRIGCGNSGGGYNSYEVPKNRLGCILRRWCVKIRMENKKVLWGLKEEYK